MMPETGGDAPPLALACFQNILLWWKVAHNQARVNYPAVSHFQKGLSVSNLNRRADGYLLLSVLARRPSNRESPVSRTP